jgi:hypothetical protein
MRSTFTPKRILTDMAVGGGVAGGVGFVGSGGELRGIPSGIGGGLRGSLSGGLKGVLALGALGVAGGLGLSTAYGRKAMVGFAEKHATWFGSKLPRTLFGGDTAAYGVFVQKLGQEFSKAPAAHLATLGGVAGGAVGLAVGSPIGGVLGAWSAGRNIRSSTAYNNFSGIGM